VPRFRQKPTFRQELLRSRNAAVPNFWDRQLHRVITHAVHVREAQDSFEDILSEAAPCRVLSTSWTLAVFCVSTFDTTPFNQPPKFAGHRQASYEEHGLTCREVEDLQDVQHFDGCCEVRAIGCIFSRPLDRINPK